MYVVKNTLNKKYLKNIRTGKDDYTFNLEDAWKTNFKFYADSYCGMNEEVVTIHDETEKM